MVFLNKQLLKSKQFNLNAPFFVTFIQCLVSVVFCHFVSLLFQLRGRTDFPSLRYRFDYKISREVLPLSICFVSMITFNNLALRDLGVAFYNIGRSLTTLFNVLMSYLILKKTTPYLALVCCGVIMLGYVIGINAENSLVDLSYIGLVYGALASMFVSLNAIYTAKVLPSVSDNPWKLGYYNNINSCVLLLPMVVLSNDVVELSNYSQLFSPFLWVSFVVVGVFGFMTGFMSTWQIQVTTPLTHNISGTAKACAQTVLAVIYFQTPKTFIWWVSNIMVLLGSMFYTIVRRNAMQVAHSERVKVDKDVEAKPLVANA